MRQSLLSASYGVSVIVLLLGYTSHFIPAVRPISIFNWYAEPGLLFHLYFGHFTLFAILSELTLILALSKTQDANTRNQLKYIIGATALGFVTGWFSFLPIYGIAINPLTTHLIWLYTAIISYAIVRHRLMNIEIVIRKGLIYFVLVGLITAMYFLFVYLSGLLFQNFIGPQPFLNALIIFTFIALCFKPLERKIQDFVDKLLFRKNRAMLEKENVKLLEEVRNQDRMKAVATLAAGMAHEIKNPLTTIRVFAEYLPDRYDEPDFRKNFKRIVMDEVDRMNHLVGQLLDFSKPKAPDPVPDSMESVIDETLDLLSNNLIKTKVEVVRRFAPLSPLSIDRNQMKQVFLNLFLNSIQAMPNGGTLTVSTVAENGAAVIKVSDTGTGISKDAIPHIFDPFYTTRTESGTGLGLAIVYGIIKEHGGRITARSALGEGTEFRIELPLEKNDTGNFSAGG